jgi:hypothetical protein
MEKDVFNAYRLIPKMLYFLNNHCLCGLSKLSLFELPEEFTDAYDIKVLRY